MTRTSQNAAPIAAATVHLDDLVDRARRLAASGERRVLGLAGTPGAGKSTVSDALLAALGSDAVLVGMDGFHLANEELIRLGRRDRKGAPDTFDVDGYVALLDRIRAGREVYAPRFDRSLEESIGSAVLVPADVPLVITEGNYLLHDEHGWDAVASRLDEVWFLDIDAYARRKRLVARRLSHDHPHDEAVAWVREVDERNAAVVERGRHRAHLVVTVSDAPAGGVGHHEGASS
ncbi:Panthothenate kinase [Microbacterium sp. ru370.1]|uniref:nucleoside/nucleotide kinase family protein n=1 Tax=unclassified Microbacterium TaxID=2609290 RepID=UPI00088B3EAC|nr:MULTISPECIES: nucleoside/nucleotide kinase family protein [unclassified Microbacterium]SDO90674.1 Panthothenate kinase [Microbacterium sp. ru370.1]SIT93431.1 Panthothenate kinase [Microbacterium sp. RU1D]